MILDPITKGEVYSIIHNGTPLENIFNGVFQGPPFGSIQRMKFCEDTCTLLGWYHVHGLTTRDAIKYHWKKLGELLGFSPLCFINFEYRNAIWGFEWEGERFVLMESIRGLSIEVPISFTRDKAHRLVKELIAIIC